MINLKKHHYTSTNHTRNHLVNQLILILLSGILTLSKWCEAMEAATKLGLPWRLLREKLAPPDSETPINTDVNYKKTLEMLETDLIVSV